MAKTNNARRYHGETTQHRPDFAELRRKEAKERQETYDALTVQQKIERLDAKFGVGQGAQKERAKLLRAGNKSKPPVEQPENLAAQTLPDEVMEQIAAINEEHSGKKKLKAKDRRTTKNS